MNAQNNISYALAHHFSGPILFNYVWWILYQAHHKKLDTLYFLARDGYLLCEIANMFCQKFQLPLNCKYLYCSRTSLRMPSYHLIGDEAYDLLLLGGYQITLRSLLLRADLNAAQRKTVCEECGLQLWDETAILSHQEWVDVCNRLRKSQTYRTLIEEKSRMAYQTTINYLRQEGLFDHEIVALVDSGWTGSMQRSLRQLLQAEGFQGNLVGFYFGMYTEPKSPEDGTYLTCHFDADGKIWNKIPFCNNLFECLLSAPHGMTIGYSKKGQHYAPILLPGQQQENLQCINQQIHEILAFTKQKLTQIVFAEFPMLEFQRDIHKRISRYMAHPTMEEARFYGRFLFCDDVTEAYHLKLAGPEQIEALKGYSIPSRVMRRLLKRRPKIARPELLWPYGTIAFLPRWKQPWYRWNVYIWEWIRYVLR